ncbi:hypothetical protein IEQ34_007215 [Dendrobium chrysotoxum]|uniref:Uncharacterized protein n=1 Tax=Dendrobium chrysotoxum TaxID=161865 RepID=A0AAV7GSJ4_DENCH|nr:hypothetical protein IEQ34_007215 [Dendrobium chrysotoxum]
MLVSLTARSASAIRPAIPNPSLLRATLHPVRSIVLDLTDLFRSESPWASRLKSGRLLVFSSSDLPAWMHKDGTWSSEDAMQRWTQACKLLAEEGLTPEDDNIEANERVFAIVMGPEHSGRVRTQGFGVTPTRFFPQSKTEGGSGSNFGQIASLREEFRSFQDNQKREFGLFRDEMRQFMQGFQMNHPPHGGSEMGGNDNSSDA